MKNLAKRIISRMGGLNRLFVAYTILTALVMAVTIMFNHFFPHTTFGLVLMVISVILAADLVVSFLFYYFLVRIQKGYAMHLDDEEEDFNDDEEDY